jgi:hypothetical protein
MLGKNQTKTYCITVHLVMTARVSYPNNKEAYGLIEERGFENKCIYAEYFGRKSFNRRNA